MIRDSREGTIAEEIDEVSMFRPHVVVLGAGASRAACPAGDSNGKLLPLMADFVDVLGLAPLIQSWGLVSENWSKFIHSHHYEIDTDFYQSWIANYPRRTGEAYWNQYMECKYLPNNPLPRGADFPELWEWFTQFAEAEERAEKTLLSKTHR